MNLRHFKRPLLAGEYDDEVRTACGRVILWRWTSAPQSVTCPRCVKALTTAERAPSPCAVEIPDSCLRARITVRKDGVVTKVVEVRGAESAVCRPAPEADDAA